jgi:rhodanese-related sulfurtransferase
MTTTTATATTSGQAVTPQDVEHVLREGRAVRLIDVRTPGEFAAVHAAGAVSVPLDRLDAAAVPPPTGDGPTDGPVYVICQSGARGAVACRRLRDAGMPNVFNVEGGTKAWEKAGLPVVRGERAAMSLERQVRIVAGTLVLVGSLLGWQFHPTLHAISALVGAGLVVAGVSDWCGMGMLLARLPWNRK